MALETQEVLWQEVECSTTEPQSDDGIVDPLELLRGIKNKKHSLDAGDDACTTKKPARSNTTNLTHLGLALLSLAASAPSENDRGTGNYGAQITSSAARRDINLSAAVHESCIESEKHDDMVLTRAEVPPRARRVLLRAHDPAVEALRRARGSAWKGGGFVQWMGTSMGRAGGAGRRRNAARGACNHYCFPHKQRQPAAPVLSALSPPAHAPEPRPSGTHAHGPAHSHVRALPCAAALAVPPRTVVRDVWCAHAVGHEKRKADMSMTVMCRLVLLAHEKSVL
ncbi:hypothetical protein JB92DRAFT_2824641 [Gautieria morchelliformis]|nr:hypothetical protein JB92DRAFT_2824641 [Gautieria morchelliformis]